jgi:adenine-specific DNA methylase
MLLGLLLPDPCDSLCPEDFKGRARSLLPQVQGTVGPKDEDLRRSLLRFIGDFANWDLSSDRTYLEVSRGLVKAAHPEETPLVVDPFSGGGSIPLEALRLGCETFASDLNPVACLLLKVMLEDIPRHGPELADELRRAGAEIKASAERELAEFYPPDPDGAKPIAYLWARTVRCEAPNCGAEIPLVRSFWLSKKAGKKRALRYKVIRPVRRAPYVEFEIFDAKRDNEVSDGTVTRAKATCLCCDTVLAPERVRAQLVEQRGGADVIFDDEGNRSGGALLLSVVLLRPEEKGRHYRLATDRDYKSVLLSMRAVREMTKSELRSGVPTIPHETISLNEIRRISMPIYGATTWGDIFTARQKASLALYTDKISKSSAPDAIVRLLALAFNRLLILSSAHCRWKPTGESLIDMFGRHAIGMVWDFAEAPPGSEANSIFWNWLQQFTAFIEFTSQSRLGVGHVQLADATNSPLPDDSCSVWFTDPPYYDSIPYAHLADCFYVWLKRSLLLKEWDMFSSELILKDGECVVDRPHSRSLSTKDEVFYENKIKEAAAEGRRILTETGCGCIVFAHKTTEGWEALLSGIISSNWMITASWPIATELTSRLNARDTASLATSVHLICRPRHEDAPVGDWGDVLRELPNRVGDWMERLQKEHIRGADLVFACIGPALEIFSRYSKVETADGREVKLAEYLEKVWEVVGRLALEQILGTAEAKARNGASGALEEDSRLTALFLWTLQSTNGDNGNPSPQPSPPRDEGETAGDDDSDNDEDESPKGKQKGFSLVFDVVRRFAQPLGIHLEAWEGRIIETKKGVVRLFSINERAKQLFGEDGAQAIADRIESSPEGSVQLALFAGREEGAVPEIRGKSRQRKGVLLSDETMKPHREATTLDRVHASMLLQASGRASALRALLKAEQDRSPDFLRLANALTALYPKDSEEKRLLDAMLLAVPR